MERYIGVKLVNAKPMNKQAYCDLRDWAGVPSDEDPNEEGYLVEYIDGGEPNTAEYSNYVSWSPNHVFDNAYRRTDGMNFGLAIEAIKKGYKVARAGWNEKGMWCIYIPGSIGVLFGQDTPYRNALDSMGEMADHEQEILPHIDMWTINAEGRRAFLPGWLASQTDMLSDDWEIID